MFSVEHTLRAGSHGPTNIARTAFALGLCLALSSFFVAPACAQQITADVVGTVTDPSGGAVPGAKVTVENAGTGQKRTAETNTSGEYSVTLLPIGRYVVRIEAQGFKTFAEAGILLSSGARVRVDAPLAVGQVTEAIDVTAQAAALQTDSSSVNATVTETAVQDLPSNGRNFITLALLTPGANAASSMGVNSGNRSADRRMTNSISVNGQSDMLNNHQIDGLDNTVRGIGTLAVRPSIDAIAEVRVQTNLYSAESTRTAGGVINVLTKSGTNELHGTLYEFLRNDKVDARDFFAAQNPEYRQNQFGGSLGGPIRKNRTFFFGDVEVLRQIQGQTFTTTVPTVYERAHIGDFSDNNNGPVVPASRIDPVGLKFFNLYPAPNKPGLFANYVSSPNRTQKSTTYDLRVDHRFTENDAFFGRYSYNTTDTFIPGGLPTVNGIQPSGNVFGFQGTSYQKPQNGQLNYVHIFSPKLLLELKMGYTRFGNSSYSLNYGHNYSQEFGMPGVNVSDVTSGLASLYIIGYASLGDNLYLPATRMLNTFQYAGSVAYNTGNHSVKVGSSLIRRQMNVWGAGYPLGWWIFVGLNYPPVSTSNAAANLLMGAPAQVQRELPTDGTRGVRFWEAGVYAQDDWRVTRWLTLNLGLRYDVFPPFTEVHNWISNFDPVTAKVLVASSSDPTAGMKTDKGNLAPRFGFAATLPHAFVVRGGFGVSYFPANQLYPDLLTTPFDYTFGPASFRPLSSGFPTMTKPDAANPSGSITSRALDFKSAYLEQYNLTMQKQIGANVFSAGYVGALGRRLVYGDRNINLPPPSTSKTPMSLAPYASILPNVTSILYAMNGGTSSYQALQATFQRQLSKGLSINANWVWGHAIDDISNGSAPNTAYGLSPNSLSATEKGNSDLDVRHRIVFSAVYNVPFGRSLTGFRAAAVKGWQVNTIATWQTSLPFTVMSATPSANLGPTINYDRPNRISSGVLSNPTIDRWFDTSAFAAQTFGTLGNEGRNTLFGPHTKRVDISLFKEFPIRERLRTQFRAECYNISNTPAFAGPANMFGQAGFGQIVGTIPGVGARVFQFALKMLF